MQIIFHPNIIKNLDQDENRARYLIEKFAISKNPYKFITDHKNILLTEHLRNGGDSELGSVFFSMMSKQYNSYTYVKSKIHNTKPKSLVRLAKETDDKIILSDSIDVFMNQINSIFKHNIRIITWNEIFGNIDLINREKSISNAINQFDLRKESSFLNEEIAKYFANNPKLLNSLSPRNFEKLINEILKSLGFETILTPETRDGGKDIIAHYQTPLGDIICHIECKRYSPKNKIGIDVVERFLFNVRDKSKINIGAIFTTSKFSSESIKLADKYKYQLKLFDIDKLKEMLEKYNNLNLGYNDFWVK